MGLKKKARSWKHLIEQKTLASILFIQQWTSIFKGVNNHSHPCFEAGRTLIINSVTGLVPGEHLHIFSIYLPLCWWFFQGPRKTIVFPSFPPLLCSLMELPPCYPTHLGCSLHKCPDLLSWPPVHAGEGKCSRCGARDALQGKLCVPFPPADLHLKEHSV